jgi:hypothetical protein
VQPTASQERAHLTCHRHAFHHQQFHRRNLPRFTANLDRVEPGAEQGHSTWHIRAADGKIHAVDKAIAG